MTPLSEISERPYAEKQIIEMGRAVAEALVQCEKRKTVHGAVSPQNIYVSPEGEYRLGGPGQPDNTVSEFDGGVSAGSFLAPEVYSHQNVGTAADIYSLGLVLYWLMNEHRLPFCPPPPAELSESDLEEARSLRISGEPILAPVNGSTELRRIVMKACAFAPADRYQSAGELLQDLNNLMNNGEAAYPSALREISEGTGIGTAWLRKPAFWIAAGSLLLVLLAFFLIPGVSCTVLGHKWNGAGCTVPQTCRRCGKTSGKVLGHSWTEASCTAPLTCQRCGQTLGKALGHVWYKSFSCVRCGESAGEGDSVFFGTYGGSDIEWLILKINNERALVISRYGLDARPYHTDEVAVTWESCSLRSWLNGEFYNSAFSEEEKNNIRTSNISNKDNPDYGTMGGNSTQDKIVVCSIDNVTQYFAADSEKACYPTAYAKENGCKVSEAGTCAWWLRTPGENSACAVYVSPDGKSGGGIINIQGDKVSEASFAVRPILWYTMEN